MKVFGLSMGRKMGNGEILLKHALKACEDAGLEVSFARLHDYKIKPCTGCELCTKLRRNNEPAHCMYGWDEDDYMELYQQIHDCDGLIISAPAYHLMPPGIGTVMLNRNHCLDIYNRNKGKRTVCATIGVGGSDWTSLFMPILNFTANEMLGNKMNLVDQMKLHRTPAIGLVLCNQKAMDRATLLGQNVAAELMDSGSVKYRGDMEGICPVCHNDVVVVRNGRVACAICDYEGDPVIKDGKIDHIQWDGGVELTRWSARGIKHHDDEQFNTVKMGKNGYEFTDEQKAAMRDGRAQWSNYLTPVKPTLREEE